MTRVIVVLACFRRFIFAPESTIFNVFLIGEFGGVLIQFIKLTMGLLILILLIVAPNRHLRPF